ncbi:hypothetical protein [Streptomyces sp. NPDC002790]|uniref:hypothetical protein n=1 Tax=Streptomyces sp. NPDC002790 TaxID=3154431 RepID=UPI003331D273
MDGQLAPVALQLSIPTGPLYRLWRQAAPEIRLKTTTRRHEENTTEPDTQPLPPLDHSAFRDLTETQYDFYAGVFLSSCRTSSAGPRSATPMTSCG